MESQATRPGAPLWIPQDRYQQTLIITRSSTRGQDQGTPHLDIITKTGSRYDRPLISDHNTLENSDHEWFMKYKNIKFYVILFSSDQENRRFNFNLCFRKIWYKFMFCKIEILFEFMLRKAQPKSSLSMQFVRTLHNLLHAEFTSLVTLMLWKLPEI